MDNFSKWPGAYALPNQEATMVADVLVSQFFSRFGVPAKLHTDHGPNFGSRVFQGRLFLTRKPQPPSCIPSLKAWWNATTAL